MHILTTPPEDLKPNFKEGFVLSRGMMKLLQNIYTHIQKHQANIKNVTRQTPYFCCRLLRVAADLSSGLGSKLK
jgi:hypothetical protein